MSELDLEKNGSIDYNEFVSASFNKSEIFSKKNLDTVFKALNKVKKFI